MRITTRGRYALRASLALARLQRENTPVSINQISKEERISSVFLEQIFFRLRKAGVVSSVRGPGGGFLFVKPPDKLSIREILAAAGEELNITDCDKQAKACEILGRQCLSHSVWRGITRILNDYLGRLTLGEVLRGEVEPQTAPDTKTVPHPSEQPETP